MIGTDPARDFLGPALAVLLLGMRHGFERRHLLGEWLDPVVAIVFASFLVGQRLDRVLPARDADPC